MKTEAVHNKMAKKLAEVKVATLVTLLSDKNADAIIDSLADTLTDVEMDKLGKTVAKHTQNFLSKNWPNS